MSKTNKINDTTRLTLTKSGYWLWDENRGMNLAMRAPTPEAALTEALEYYQRRCREQQEELKIYRDWFTKNLESALELNKVVELVYIPEDNEY